MKTPILETNRLILRPFKREDAANVFACWESDPDVAKYLLWRWSGLLGFQYEKDIPYPCNDGAVMREGIQCRLGLEESYEYLWNMSCIRKWKVYNQ